MIVRNKRWLFYTIIMMCLFLWGQPIFATSWVELSPEEVSKRADVIVIGSYDFSSDGKEGKNIFYPIKFHVKGVYKGEASETLRTGIDPYDMGWVEETQDDGGEFLLFLEDGGDPFLTPVGGPNGMITIMNGNVQDETIENKRFYETYLSQQSKAPLSGKDEEKTFFREHQGMILFIGILFITVTVFLIRHLYDRKK